MKKYLKTLFSFLFVFSLILTSSSSFAQTGDIDPNPSTTECVSLENNLRYRDRDSNKNGEVSLLQDFLQSKGYLNSEPTGYFGILTFKAVKDFQRDNGINPTGYVGSITRAKIVNLTCTLAEPLTPVNPPVNPPNTNFPPGCTSNLGYSMTTGLPCDRGMIQGVKITILKEGNGDIAKFGDILSVNYTGKLLNGIVFDSNIDQQFNHVQPFVFTLGVGQAIKGWDMGIVGMKVGEKRRLEINSEYAYGTNGVGEKIPPNADLIFEVELLRIEKTLITLQQGDVNGDGLINCTDTTWITESVLQNRVLTAEQKKRADMNGDGNVTTADNVLLTQRFGLNCSTTAVITDPVSVGSTVGTNSQNPSIFKGKVNANDLAAVWNIPSANLTYWFRYGRDSNNLDSNNPEISSVVPQMPIKNCGSGDGPLIPCTPDLGLNQFSQGIGGFPWYTTYYVKACVGDATLTNNVNQILNGTVPHFKCGNVVSFMIQPTTTTPSITVLSPNGGELYTRGETSQTGDFLSWSIKVVGVSSTGDTSYTLKNVNGNNIYFGGNGGFNPDYPIEATGSGQLYSDFVPIGKYYFVAKWTGSDGLVLEDQSDNYFTVTSKGDVNGDGLINCTDTTWITESVLQNRVLTAEQKKRADMNGDGNVSTLDAVLLSQKYGLNCGTSVPQIQILSIIGNRPNYSTDSTETIELAIKTTDGKGLPALSQNGYYIQAYIYKANDTNFFQYLEPNPPYSYNGIYNSATELWEVTMKPPSTIGSYNLKVSLYCSNTNLCDRNTIQSVKILPFTVTSIIFQQGDVNGDGLINCTDTTWITESVLQNRVLTAEQKKRADMNGDGNVTTADATKLIQTYGLNCGTTIPLIALLSPNGGEIYEIGKTYNIEWTSSNMPNGAVTRLMLVRNLPNNAQDIYQILETTNNIDIKTGSYLWQIPSNIIPASNYFMTIVCGLGNTNCQAVNNISSTMTDTSNLFTINAPTTTSLDSTPRIAYWGGKVGQHTDREGNWISDPDGTSGVVETDAGRLTYCKKWYPNTTNVTAYKTETITTWKRSIFNEQSNYTNTVTTYKCIEAFGYNTPNNSKLSSILGSSLQANALGAVNNTNTNQTVSQIAPKALSVPVLSCTSFTLLLEQKMNNNEVKCLQKLLNEKGYKVTENGKETTYFGSVTLSALEKFQKDNNLKVDGKFGLESSRILMK